MNSPVVLLLGLFSHIDNCACLWCKITLVIYQLCVGRFGRFFLLDDFFSWTIIFDPLDMHTLCSLLCSGRRDFGDFSVYKPSKKPPAADQSETLTAAAVVP